MIIAIIVVLVLLALGFVTFPGCTAEDKHDVESFIKVAYAHRGLHNLDNGVPENSAKSFHEASAAGYGIELDVRLSSDNKVMVFHDDTLKRMCGIDAKVSDYTCDELENIMLLDTGETIPSLERALSVISKDTPVIVELKTGKKHELLCELTAEHLRSAGGTYCIESFDPRIVGWFRRNAPEFIRGQLSSNMLKSKTYTVPLRIILTNLFFNFIARPHFIAYNHNDISNPFYILITKVFGAISVVWTVRDMETFNRFKKDCDMIIFEGFLPETRY